MTPHTEILSKRLACALVSLFCLAEAAWSWFSIQGSGHQEPAVDLAFFGFAIFITVSIAYRSSFWADRIVFGAMAGAFALAIVCATPLAPNFTLAAGAARAAMWTVAATVSLLALAQGARGPRPDVGEGRQGKTGTA